MSVPLEPVGSRDPGSRISLKKNIFLNAYTGKNAVLRRRHEPFLHRESTHIPGKMLFGAAGMSLFLLFYIGIQRIYWEKMLFGAAGMSLSLLFSPFFPFVFPYTPGEAGRV